MRSIAVRSFRSKDNRILQIRSKSPAWKRGRAFFLFSFYDQRMAYKPQDTYFKKAKQQGYRSRAAYKLIELQERFHLFRPGQRVVDLGAAPGGWLQIAAKYLKPNGKVV